jgi:hypothetical protein
MRTNPLHHLLRAAALSAALIAGGAATALADVPGYDFPNEWQPRHAPMQMQAAPLAAQAGPQTSRPMANASLAAGRGKSNQLPAVATPAWSGG